MNAQKVSGTSDRLISLGLHKPPTMRPVRRERKTPTPSQASTATWPMAMIHMSEACDYGVAEARALQSDGVLGWEARLGTAPQSRASARQRENARERTSRAAEEGGQPTCAVASYEVSEVDPWP